MADNLQVGIGANVDGLRRGLKQAESDLKKFKGQSDNAAAGTNKFGKSTANAVPALNEFSRVIQDAPFGIQGVANNITQLTQNFGYLSKSTGGTKAALKAMLGTLTGPAGILLAVSAVTSLMVAFGDKLTNVKNAASELLEAQKDLVGSAQSEITTYSTLLNIAKDTNKNYEERKRALDKVNDISGKYIGNLELEGINSETTANKTNKYTEALIRQAKIKGLQSRISELFAKKFEIENQALDKNVTTVQKSLLIIKNSLLGYGTGAGVAGAKADLLTKAFENQQEESSKTQKEIDSLNKSLQNLLSEDISIGGVFTNTGDATKDAKESITAQVKELETSLPAIGLKLNFNAPDISTNFDEVLAVVDEKAMLFKAKMVEFQNVASQIVSGGITDAFSGIGEAIGGALASGASIVDALGGALLSSIGDIAVQLGKSAIAIGVGMIAIKNAFSNPATAIAAGVALVAVGSLIKGAAATVGQVGQGGAASGVGGSGSSGNNFGTTTSTQSGGFNGGRVVFEIGGDKLIGVLNNTSLGNLRVGDSDQLITTG